MFPWKTLFIQSYGGGNGQGLLCEGRREQERVREKGAGIEEEGGQGEG